MQTQVRVERLLARLEVVQAWRVQVYNSGNEDTISVPVLLLSFSPFNV